MDLLDLSKKFPSSCIRELRDFTNNFKIKGKFETSTCLWIQLWSGSLLILFYLSSLMEQITCKRKPKMFCFFLIYYCWQFVCLPLSVLIVCFLMFLRLVKMPAVFAWEYVWWDYSELYLSKGVVVSKDHEKILQGCHVLFTHLILLVSWDWTGSDVICRMHG